METKLELYKAACAIVRGVLTCLSYPRGSEAQVRCLEEVGQQAGQIAPLLPEESLATVAQIEAERALNAAAPELLKALMGLIPCCQNCLSEGADYKECGRPAFYYASFGMHVCEECATAPQLERTTPELQAARDAIAKAQPAPTIAPVPTIAPTPAPDCEVGE